MGGGGYQNNNAIGFKLMSGMDYTVSGVFFKGNMLFYDENKLKMSPAGSEAPYFTIIIYVYIV